MPIEPPVTHQGPFIEPRSRRPRRRMRRRWWRHAAIHLSVAAIGIGFAATQGAFDRPDTTLRDVPKLTQLAHDSDDPGIPGGSELMRIIRLDGDRVVVQAVLGREFTWGTSTAAIRTKLDAATGDQVIVTWTRDTEGRPVVSGVLGE